MNCFESGCSNYLILNEDNEVLNDLFKISTKLAEKCKSILFIAPKPFEQLPTTERPEKEILKRIIFIYVNDIDAVIEKLLELHCWSITPKLVIINSLHEYTHSANSNHILHHKYCLLIGSLLNCITSLQRKLKEPCFSIVTIVEKSNFPKDFLPTLVDFYYYKSTFNKIPDHLLEGM